MRSPWLPAMVLSTAYLAHPLANSLGRLISQAFPRYGSFLLLAIGIAGIVTIGRALERPESQATAAGFAGAMLAWAGFVHGQIALFTERFAASGNDTTGIGVTLAAVIFFLPLFLVYGPLNKETRCNFMRWWHRRLRMSPGQPTPGVRRSVARITAMETMFVCWVVYPIFVWNEPDYSYYVLTPIALWVAYILWQLARHTRAALAFRYSIPVAALLWGLTEAGAARGLYPEIWLTPQKYLLPGAAMLLLFLAGLAAMSRHDREQAGLSPPLS